MSVAVSAHTSESEEPIVSIEQLVALLQRASKPRASRRVGVEHEKLLAHGSGPRKNLAPDHATIARVLDAIADDAKRNLEGDALIGLELVAGGSVSLEPGGQLELSSAPRFTLGEALADNDQHLDRLLAVCARPDFDLEIFACGFRPYGSLDDVPWMPKGRYAVMREYLPTRGTRGHEMMKRTATVQANFDWLSEADAMDQQRTAMGIGPIVTSLFAASPLVDGKPSGYQSFRAYQWLDTDRDRSGLLPFVFEPGSSFRDYVEWALDVPMFFVRRHGQFLPANGVTFRQFWQQQLFEGHATLGDWDLHNSTLFPNVRLRSYLEVRQADASTRAMAKALPALWLGVLYDETARHCAWKLVDKLTFATRQSLEETVPRLGLRTDVDGRAMLDLARELVAIADDGLVRVDPASRELLAPLTAIATTGRSRADEILDGAPLALT